MKSGNHPELTALVFLLFALHLLVLFVFGLYTDMTVVMGVLAVLDASAAIVYGLRTDSDKGHLSIILGICVILTALVFLFIFYGTP